MPRTTFSPRGNTPQTPPPPPATGGGTTPHGPTPGINPASRWRNNPPRVLTGLQPGYGPRSGDRMNRPAFLPKTEPQIVQKQNGGGGGGGGTGGGGGGTMPGDDQTKVIAPFWTRPAALYFLGALIVLPLIFKKIK